MWMILASMDLFVWGDTVVQIKDALKEEFKISDPGELHWLARNQNIVCTRNMMEQLTTEQYPSRKQLTLTMSYKKKIRHDGL